MKTILHCVDPFNRYMSEQGVYYTMYEDYVEEETSYERFPFKIIDGSLDIEIEE